MIACKQKGLTFWSFNFRKYIFFKVLERQIKCTTRIHSVKCKPPTCRQYGLHKIWRDEDILLWPWCYLHLDVWTWPYYCLQMKFAKVMFLHLSAGTPPAAGTPPRAGTPWEGTHPQAVTPPGRYYEIWSMSGQYAAYWNAFLLMACNHTQRINVLK